MKKGLSTILLIIFLFNVGGYYIVYWGLRYNTDQQLASRLDANLYDPEETILLKIPVTLPYPIESNGFQRVDGSFEHNGEFFKLIKNKLQDDTLYVVCIRDHETRRLVKTMKDYVSLTQGLADQNSSQKTLHFLSKLAKDYCSNKAIDIVHRAGFVMVITYEQRPEDLFEPSLPVHAPPPRA